MSSCRLRGDEGATGKDGEKSKIDSGLGSDESARDEAETDTAATKTSDSCSDNTLFTFSYCICISEYRSKCHLRSVTCHGTGIYGKCICESHAMQRMLMNT